MHIAIHMCFHHLILKLKEEQERKTAEDARLKAEQEKVSLVS
jgi:hypothetical protein